MGVATGLYMYDVFSTGDSSGSELCARILKSLAKAAWCLWCVSTVFTRSAINSAGSDAIRMKNCGTLDTIRYDAVD